MTRDEILAMEAGYVLDLAVHRRFGLPHPRNQLKVFHYSMVISDAWLVVEMLKGYEFRISNEYHNGEWWWYCGIEQPEDLGERFFSATSKALPEAICKAALLATVEVIDE